MLIRALVFGLVLSATPWSVFAASLSVPITVTERAGTPRKAEIVSLGVPLPKAEGVTTTDGLQMVDADGRVVPAQFRPLSRWGPLNDATRPIRWVLADFEASVGGKTTATYTLTRASSGAAGVNGIAVTDTPQMVAVDTGTMTVRVPKGGGYLFEAVVGGRTYRTSGIRILRGEREFSSEAIKPASVPKELGLISRAGQFYLHTIWSSSPR